MKFKINRLMAIIFICLSFIIISNVSYAKRIGKPAIIYSLKPLVVNLSGENGSNYLKITIVLECDRKQVANEISYMLPKIMDSTLTLLNSKTFEELHTSEGKVKLREDIAMKINLILETGQVRHIYFTEFVLM